MPVKRRLHKGRRLDEHCLQMLREGPDTMLFAGCGYLAIGPVAHFSTATADERQTILSAMQDDWSLHGPSLASDGADWWAARQFGRA